MNTWKTLLESYQQREYKNTLSTVKCQVQRAENATPAVVISVDSAHVDNAILVDNVTSQVGLEEGQIESTDQPYL